MDILSIPYEKSIKQKKYQGQGKIWKRGSPGLRGWVAPEVARLIGLDDVVSRDLKEFKKWKLRNFSQENLFCAFPEKDWGRLRRG